MVSLILILIKYGLVLNWKIADRLQNWFVQVILLQYVPENSG